MEIKNKKQKSGDKKMNTKHGILLAMFGILVFCAFIGTASAATIYVHDNYAKIQWAVDNASVGDTLILKEIAPEEEWNKTFGGSEDDRGKSVVQTSDGGYIIVGSTRSYGAGENDVWLIKTDADGNKVWDKTFGQRYNDISSSVAQTQDGGYIITGYTRGSHGGDADLWLIKTDAHGNKVWDKIRGGSEDDRGNSVAQTLDGGYIVVGTEGGARYGHTAVWLIKTDTYGNGEWNRYFGGSPDNDGGTSVAETSEGGYIITGYTESYGAGRKDVWLIKIDADGHREWDETFGGSGDDIGLSVAQTLDGGYIIAGSTVSYGAGNRDVWLVKTDDGGNKVWDKSFGDIYHDSGYSVAQTLDGGYIVAGTTGYLTPGASGDVWLIKTDADGNKVWDKTFGGSGQDSGSSLSQTSDGGYIITGYTGYYGGGNYANVWLIKVRGEPTEPTIEPTETPITPTPTKPTQTPITTPTEPTLTPTTPAFEAIFAIAGSLAIAYLLRRRG